MRTIPYVKHTSYIMTTLMAKRVSVALTDGTKHPLKREKFQQPFYMYSAENSEWKGRAFIHPSKLLVTLRRYLFSGKDCFRSSFQVLERITYFRTLNFPCVMIILLHILLLLKIFYLDKGYIETKDFENFLDDVLCDWRRSVSRYIEMVMLLL